MYGREEIERIIAENRKDVLERCEMVLSVIDLLLDKGADFMSEDQLLNADIARDLLIGAQRKMLDCPPGPCPTPSDAVQRINILVDVVEMINHCADHMQRVADGFPAIDESEEPSDDSVVIITEISLN